MAAFLHNRFISPAGLLASQSRRVGVKAWCFAKTDSPGLDVLLGAQKLHVLDHAERELGEFCSNMRSDSQRRECWEVILIKPLDSA